MLIKVRSSETDPNNTASQLFMNFKDTLILKPNTRIALVSALITTNKTDGYKIDTTNRFIKVAWGELPNNNIQLATGNYSGEALATLIQNALRADRSGLWVKDTYYPNDRISCSFDPKLGFSIEIGYMPQVQAMIIPDSPQFVLSNFNAKASGWGYADNAGYFDRAMISNIPIIPLGEVANGEETGFINIDRILNETDTDVSFGISNGTNSQNIIGYRLEVGNVWTNTTTPTLKAVWQKLRVANANGYNWLCYEEDTASNTFNTRYVLEDVDGRFYWSDTDTADPKASYTYDVSLGKDADGNIASFSTTQRTGGAVFRTYTAATPAPPIVSNYFSVVATSAGNLELYAGGSHLNPNTPCPYTSGASLQMRIPSMISSNAFPENGRVLPRFYLKDGDGKPFEPIHTDVAINRSLGYARDDVLKFEVRCNKVLDIGGIGMKGGAGGITQLSESFQAADITFSGATPSMVSGEQLYQTATSGSGKGFSAYVVNGGSKGASGAISGVVVGFVGTSYAFGDTITMRGLISNQSVILQLPASYPRKDVVISTAGTGYATINSAPFTGGSGTGAVVSITSVGGSGEITGVRILNRGIGYNIGDVLTFTAGSGTAQLTINQVSHEEVQFKTGQCSLKDTGGYEPLNPNNHLDINFGNDPAQNGVQNILDLDDAHFVGELEEDSVVQFDSEELPRMNNPSNESVLVNLPDIPIGSRNGAGNTDNHIATIPYTNDLDDEVESTKQHYEPYSMIYHRLDNEDDLNLNHIRVNLTNYKGVVRNDLKHPTELTFHLDPDYR